MFKFPRPTIIGPLLRFMRDEGGATAIEYALIASGIAAAIVAAVSSVGTSVKGLYSSIATGLN